MAERREEECVSTIEISRYQAGYRGEEGKRWVRQEELLSALLELRTYL
jgi:hypothetical protein